MLTHRYIQAVLTRDLVEGIKQDPNALEKIETALGAEELRDRSEQLSFRFVDLDRRFGI